MKIKGFVERFIYISNRNSYSVLNLVNTDSEDGEVCCTGYAHGIDVGDYVELEGEMADHPVYGPQFQFQSFQVLPPDGVAAVERYLASGTIKGIGAAIAHRLTQKFGEDTLRIMEEEPERLVEIKGISERIAQNIAEQVIEKRDVRNAMMFLQKFRISNTLAAKIYHFYGDEIYQLMEENPYRIAEEVNGIGFKTMDEIALKKGMAQNSPERIRCGIQYILGQASYEGHTYLPRKILLDKAHDLLAVEEAQVSMQMDGLYIDNKSIIIKDDKIFLKELFFSELICAKRLKEIKQSFHAGKKGKAHDQKIEEEIRAVALKHDYQLDELQMEAVRLSTQNGVSLLTGGPGTGKTTTIYTIIQYFYGQGKDVLLAAPTGRAAKRMEEATGFVAKTIHRLLEVNGALDQNGERARFQRNEDYPLEADVIIIDEMSMIDVYLFAALLKAVPNGAHLILCGDANQLPSVGPGEILKNLIGCGYFPCITLNHIYRQSDGSDIAKNAALINQGIVPELGTQGRDFFFLERMEKNQLYQDMVVLLKNQLPRNFQTTSREIQVLTPMKKGIYGVEALNRLFQDYLNPASGDKPELARGDSIFRQGDKVMQMKNNYEAEWIIRGKNGIRADSDKGIFNGDTGIIQSIDTKEQKLIVLFDDNKEVEYSLHQLEEIELAYAITIHKSQGSEYPAVLLPLVEGPEILFNRNLLYTAVTRARKCLIILGDRKQIEKMVLNEGKFKRYTDFSSRLSDYLEH